MVRRKAVACPAMMWLRLLHSIPLTFVLLLRSGDGLFDWSYRDFSRWKTQGECGQPDQSPIDIVSAQAHEDPLLASVTFPSVSSVARATLRTNSHTWEVDWPVAQAPQAAVTYGGQKYFLKQFHYRSPSENTIDGKYSAMEVQHVHQAASGQLLVVSVLVDIGSESNTYLDWYLWAKFPRDSSSPSIVAEVASPYTDFMPSNKSFFQWRGSLTTPPCTTNAAWLLLQNSVSISSAQLSLYRSSINAMRSNQLHIDTIFHPDGLEDWDTTLGVNIRPTQSLGSRVVSGRTLLADASPVHSPLQKFLERYQGWVVLLLGALSGVCCLCGAACIMVGLQASGTSLGDGSFSVATQGLCQEVVLGHHLLCQKPAMRRTASRSLSPAAHSERSRFRSDSHNVR